MQSIDEFRLEQESLPERPNYSSKDWPTQYRNYLKSLHWKKFRKQKLDSVHGQCEYCGKFGGRREIHHKHYQTLGCEQLCDVLVLCSECHIRADQVRSLEGKQRSDTAFSEAIYDAGFDSYMTKKYGEHWEKDHDLDDTNEFDEWLERKESSSGDSW